MKLFQVWTVRKCRLKKSLWMTAMDARRMHTGRQRKTDHNRMVTTAECFRSHFIYVLSLTVIVLCS